jgi:DNA-binding NtrC family response regulator
MFVTEHKIDVEDLPAYLIDGHHPELVKSGSAGTSVGQAVGSLEAHEQMLVTNALERAMGNQSEAARLLKTGRDALRYKMKKFNLDRNRNAIRCPNAEEARISPRLRSPFGR